MRIIDRKAFLAHDGPVLYAKVRANCDPDEGLCIKVGNAGDNDWCYDPIDPAGALESSGSGEHADKLASMDDNPDEVASMDYESTCRDGLYEGGEVKFAVFDKEDVKRLLERLSLLMQGMS